MGSEINGKSNEYVVIFPVCMVIECENEFVEFTRKLRLKPFAWTYCPVNFAELLAKANVCEREREIRL